jgi:hypothetical protein
MQTTNRGRSWGEAREELATLLQRIDHTLYVPAKQAPLIARARDIVEHELRPRVGQRGKRVFGPLTAVQQSLAIHMHIEGQNSAQIARDLGTAEGQVGAVLREWRTGERKPYWPDENVERVFCTCAAHQRKTAGS